MTTLGPRTKGLRLDRPADPAALVGRRLDDEPFAWPLLTLDDGALTHNIEVAARTLAAHGVHHAPHVKTHMSRDLWERQHAAGAWGPSVAHAAQARTVVDWGARRLLLANELPDARDAAWARTALESGTLDELWLEIDSADGVGVLARAFAGASPAVVARLGILVELGVPGGRTGVRDPATFVALARTAHEAGLRVRGVAGYEGPVAARTDAAGREAVGAWCDTLRETADDLRAAGLVAGDVVLSAGGSAFLDVVLDRWAARPGYEIVLRPGAYVIHDEGHYRRADPWSRIAGATPLRPAATVWGQVLSVPEPGLALLGVGRRDVSFDLDLPVPRSVRTPDGDGRLGPPRALHAAVTALNDQHAFVTCDPGLLTVGDVVALGISHPCTTLDKWRTAVVTADDTVTAIYPLDF